ncbi:MAG: TSUP family transporter [Spirochaetota bacterium]
MLFHYLLISLAASSLGAISGIGGGVIIKPALDTFSPFSVATISFLSGCTVLSMTSVTLIRSRKLDVTLDKRTSTLLGVGGIGGGLLGKSLFELLEALSESDKFIGALQSALLGVMVLGVLVFIIKRKHIVTKHMESVFGTLLVGITLGGIASFLGIGGGPINVVVLYYFFSMNSKQAALNSIFIIFLSQLASLLLTTLRGLIPPFETAVLLLMIGGGVSGGLIGSYISRIASLRGVDAVFGTALAIIFAMSTYNFFQFVL